MTSIVLDGEVGDEAINESDDDEGSNKKERYRKAKSSSQAEDSDDNNDDSDDNDDDKDDNDDGSASSGSGDEKSNEDNDNDEDDAEDIKARMAFTNRSPAASMRRSAIAHDTAAAVSAVTSALLVNTLDKAEQLGVEFNTLLGSSCLLPPKKRMYVRLDFFIRVRLVEFRKPL